MTSHSLISPALKRVLMLLLCILINFLLLHAWYHFTGTSWLLLGAFIWVPLLITITLRFVFDTKKHFTEMIYSFVEIMLNDIIIFVYTYKLIDQESAFFIEEIFLLIGLPIQILLIIFVALIKHYAFQNKH